MEALLKIALLLISSALSIFVSQAFAESPDPEKGWTTTNADMSMVREFIHVRYPCFDAQKNFLGCSELVNSLGSRLKPAQVLVPKDSEEASNLPFVWPCAWPR